MLSPEVLSILVNGPLILVAIAGLVMAAWMRPPAARLLAVFGLVLVIGHAVWSLVEVFALHNLHLPSLVLDILAWLSYLVLLVGFVLLVLAATVRAKPTAPTAPPGHSWYPPAPHHRPAPHAPPARPAPEPGGADPRPGA